MSALAAVVAAIDTHLAPHALDPVPEGRFDGLPEERAFVLEAVYEGQLMHHGEPRAFAGMDPDLCLLAGDALYALGLSRLAELGDLEAIAELADLIALCAWARSAGREELLEALWSASEERLDGRGPGARAALGAADGA